MQSSQRRSKKQRHQPMFLDESNINLSSFRQDQRLGQMSKQDKIEFKMALEAQKEAIVEQQAIDILLIQDCTNSMAPWIKQSARNLVKIIDSVKQKSSYNAQIRVAYVGYRDFGDIGDRDHFDIMDYSTDLEAVAEKIKKSKARGGGDTPEDVKGALDVAFGLSHQSPVLCAFMICDAPAHGKQYHDITFDDYPNQPEMSLEKSLCQFRTLPSTDVYFTAFQLNDSTDKMYKMMKREFGNNFYVTEKVVILEDFFSTMFNSITATISKTVLKNRNRGTQPKNPQSMINDQFNVKAQTFLQPQNDPADKKESEEIAIMVSKQVELEKKVQQFLHAEEDNDENMAVSEVTHKMAAMTVDGDAPKLPEPVQGNAGQTVSTGDQILQQDNEEETPGCGNGSESSDNEAWEIVEMEEKHAEADSTDTPDGGNPAAQSQPVKQDDGDAEMTAN